MVRIYKIKWWNEYKTILCGKENVDHYCKTKSKKYTLQNLCQKGGPAIAKEDSPASSTKACDKGLSQKEREILEVLKEDPVMRQKFLQHILDKKDDSDDEPTSSAGSSTNKPIKSKRWADYEDSQDPYDM